MWRNAKSFGQQLVKNPSCLNMDFSVVAGFPVVVLVERTTAFKFPEMEVTLAWRTGDGARQVGNLTVYQGQQSTSMITWIASTTDFTKWTGLSTLPSSYQNFSRFSTSQFLDITLIELASLLRTSLREASQ